MYKKLLAFFTLFILFGFSSIGFAQNIMCGKDLRDTIDAQALQQIEEAASKIKNGNSRFWKIEKDGVEPSYLLGTMHAGDAKIAKMSSTEQAAFDKSARVALELTEIVDETGGKMLSAIVSHGNLLMYEGDDTIKAQMTEAQFQKFDAALKQRGIAYPAVERMKPWFFATFFLLPDCSLPKDGVLPKPFDVQIGLKAQYEGKELLGLETIDEQLEALAALPDSLYVAGVIEAIESQELVKDIFTTMGELYVEGKISMIHSLNDYLDEQGLAISDMQEFETILLDKRNAVMAERAEPLLASGNSFIAVGALHLIGDTGLVEAFRKMGYQVTAQK